MGRVGGFLATVLICEDEPALRELIRISLDGEYEFAEAEDGRACLEVAREVLPDVVVLDMMLPGLTGLEVLRELRRDPALAAVPVIVLTAQPATRDDALRAGANLVMDKPFNVDEIAVAVKEVLSGSS
jgi:DNA-binding response OmpR family regulator